MTEVLTQLSRELSGACNEYQPMSDMASNPTRDRIVEIARQITMSVSSPMQYTWAQSINMYTLLSLRTVIDRGILQKIPQTGAVSLQQLAKETGLQLSLLQRLLRVLVHSHFLEQNSRGEIGHTAISRAYAAQESNMLNPGTLFASGYDVVFLSLMGLHRYLNEKGSKAEPDDQAYNPYTWYHHKDGTSCWDVQAQVGDEETFQKVLSTMELAPPPVGAFDFSSLIDDSDRALLVDVAGGIGTTLASVINSHPSLQDAAQRCILQDREPVIAQAKERGALPANAQTMIHDMFQENPIKGARAYMLRRILHDWSDAKCVEILSHLADAAAPDTSIFISELVVPEHLGEKDAAIICSDMAMMHMGGKERTEEQWSALLADAGLRLVKVWNGFERESLLESRRM